MQKFVKGRANNHLTWVMVDATDFATPESALSAATKIKIYGKVRGATGVNLVSSGTGSLTADIQHVGASALGIYTIALAKADLSDASAAWYDQYIISLSATGAAYQTLVVDGGIDESSISSLKSQISDLQSYIVAMSGMLSDTHSAAILGASNASDAYSAALLVQSRLSDLDSRLVSDLSDVLSQLTVVQSMASDAASAAVQGNSRVLLVQSRLSDLDSRLSSDVSDIISGITALSGAVSDAHSAATAGASRALINQSRISDVDSQLDLLDAAVAIRRNTVASAVGDGSTVELDAGATATNDLYNGLNIILTGGTGAGQERLVVDYDGTSKKAVIKPAWVTSPSSDTTFVLRSGDPWLSDVHSDIKSGIVGLSALVSDTHSAATAGASRALINQSRISDVQSTLLLHTSTLSDLQSALSDAHSDLKSAIGAITVTLDASNISDIASAVVAALPVTSMVSDIYSLLSDLDSNFQSRVPKEVAARSQVSDLASDIVSDLKSFVGAGIPLDASSLSDIRSAITAAEFDASDVSDIVSAVKVGLASDFSDIYSAATQVNSRVLLNQSRISDIQSYLVALSGTQSDLYSLLSDLHSDVGVMSGILSDTYSLLSAGPEIGASSLSDLRSAITANGVLRAGADPTAVIGVTDTLAAKVDWLTAMSRNKLTQTATVQSLRNNADNADIASAAVSDDATTFTRDKWGN